MPTRKLRSATFATGTIEVRNGKLFYKGKEVFKGTRRDAHDFVFKDGSFAFTLTFYNHIKKELIKFRLRTR